MARLTNRHDLTPVLQAFATWFDKGLVHDRSVFTSNGLWTPANVAEVRRAFVENPDLGDDNFATKLRGQMLASTTEARQLMAEMLWALLLFPSNIKPARKRTQILEIWNLSGASLSESDPLLSDKVLSGIGSGGPGFNNHRWRELVFLIELTGSLKQRAEVDRAAILADYDAFMHWIDSVPREGSRQFRHMLRYAAFPDRVERMSSNGHRREILEAFESLPEGTTNEWGDRQLDDALFRLRQRLEQKYPEQTLDFYEPPLRDEWRDEDVEGPGEGPGNEPRDVRYWVEKTITNGRPDRLEGAFALGRLLWSPQKDKRGADIYRFMRDVQPGDVVLHFTDNNAFTGTSRAASAHEAFSDAPPSEWSGHGPYFGVRLQDFRKLDPPLSREVIFSTPVKEKLVALIEGGQKNLFFNREPSLNQGAYLTPAPDELVSILEAAYQRTAGKPLLDGSGIRLVPEHTPEPAVLDLSRVCDDFADALLASHVSFGTRHRRVVQAFIASLATKPFVILTGLSGSGKTQLAIRFGEWLGADRVKIVPVRPDWTGAEALFGYENALVPSNGGPAWHVPDALAFILRASADSAHPYLLVLDEMNLAHVERYFADFLSGMESRQPCLPLLRYQSGTWRGVSGALPIAMPRNLFVVGTVNVDETTYMFSPKVLDRANTFEFRVSTEDLPDTARRPLSLQAGHQGLVRGFLAIATDDQWHETHPSPQLPVFDAHLRRLHAILQQHGLEFGHRTYYEARRFAAMLNESGESDTMVALDCQLMQKVLPRIHGSRRRLDLPLAAIGHFAFDPAAAPVTIDRDTPRFDPLEPPGGSPALPEAFAKIQRMTNSLRQNHFVSFTE